jgi:hypothetical protein
MKTIENILWGWCIVLLTTSCSVQQFAVNTNVQAFEKGGRIIGERMEKCGKDGWKLEFKKDKDIHVLGINIRKSDAKKMAEELNASSYTIETKSNLIIQLITFGIVDYKVVTVIKRDQ